MRRRRVAFYAPLKAPDHPVPSGDRLMGGLLIKAFESAGCDVTLASDLRTYSRFPDEALLVEFVRRSETIVEDLLRSYSHNLPDVFVTYHPFYKSPDMIGPRVAVELGIPYLTIEASHAPKRNQSAWRAWQAYTEQALWTGAAHLCMTRRDRAGLAAFLGGDSRLIALPPFLDTATFETLVREPSVSDRIELITVAMMRPDGKLPTYRFLADAIRELAKSPETGAASWHLTIAGDGPARAEVENAFAGIDPTLLTWLGLRQTDELRALLSRADLFVWPGVNEAYGMAYLEAQATGLPVLALNSGGVSEVVQDGRTGILAPMGTPAEFAAVLGKMIGSRDALRHMGEEAHRFVLQERSLACATAILRATLERITA